MYRGGRRRAASGASWRLRFMDIGVVDVRKEVDRCGDGGPEGTKAHGQRHKRTELSGDDKLVWLTPRQRELTT
jgi:hypothetical protein